MKRIQITGWDSEFHFGKPGLETRRQIISTFHREITIKLIPDIVSCWNVFFPLESMLVLTSLTSESEVKNVMLYRKLPKSFYSHFHFASVFNVFYRKNI